MSADNENGQVVPITENDYQYADDMDSGLNDGNEEQIRRPEYRCLRQMSDYNNVFKSFIGTSYLSFPFGFLQSGLVLGCIVLSVVVLVTGHCCHLIVDVKKIILRQRCNIEEDEDAEDDPEYQRLARTLRFNDIGQICLGKAGQYIVDFFLVFTQTGFCVAYFIFIGNAIHDIVPPRAVHADDTTPINWTGHMDIETSHRVMRDTIALGDLDGANSVLNNFTDSADILRAHSTTDYNVNNGTNGTNITTTALPFTEALPFQNISDIVYVSVMPELKYLVLAPLLPFILFGFIRDMRHMGPWSLLANMAIIVGYFTILSLMLIGFEMDPDIIYFNWEKVPVFFGQVTCAFEGIGLVLPVEGSMRDNAHNFGPYLNSTLFLVSCILASFGILGYMRYGADVAQVITMSIPSGSIVPFTLSCTLILAVTLTFPLQVFPVLEILERYLLGVGKNNPTFENRVPDDDDAEMYEEEVGVDNEGLTTITDDEMPPSGGYQKYGETDDEEDVLLKGREEVRRKKVAPVPDWKRNILRVLIILGIAGLAVLMRDNFAYVGALIGAMGSTALGYVLPCVFHLKLTRHHQPWYIKAKDGLIIVFGCVGGVMSLVVVLQDIVDSFSEPSS